MPSVWFEVAAKQQGHTNGVEVARRLDHECDLRRFNFDIDRGMLDLNLTFRRARPGWFEVIAT